MISRRALLAGLPAVAFAPAINLGGPVLPAPGVHIAGILVTDLGVPKCATTNGVPLIPRGQGGYYSKVKGNDPAHGLTDPWNAFPSIVGTYSALVGNPSVPATAVYKYTALQRELIFVWGSPDPGDKLQLANGEEVVAMLSGNEITGKFGYRDGIYLSIKPQHGFREVKLASYGPAFEWANFLGGSCS